MSLVAWIETMGATMHPAHASLGGASRSGRGDVLTHRRATIRAREEAP